MSNTDPRIELRSRGFQSGWLKNPDGTQGKRWYLVTCGTDCACGPGCLNCPANAQAKKDKTMKVQCRPDQLLEPLQWEKECAVFVCPEGDLFHKKVSRKFIAQVFAVIESCPQHRFIIVTKRATKMKDILCDPGFSMMVYDAGVALLGPNYKNRGGLWGDNIIIGVSVENQDYMHRSEVLPLLPQNMTKAIFVAPMLGPIEIPKSVISVTGWVLCNGERGVKWCTPRPCKLEWQMKLARQCEDANVPFFLLRKLHSSWVKKMGGKKYLQFPEILAA